MGTSFLSQPEATLIAAIVALINIFITVRLSREHAKLQTILKRKELFAAEASAARQGLLELARLAQQLRSSLTSLIEQSASLSDESMMAATAGALSSVAHFYNSTGQDFRLTAPPAIVPVTDDIRRQLAAVFLEIDVKNRRNPDAFAQLKVQFAKLESQLDTLRSYILGFVNPYVDEIDS